mmetsp:Transcript_27009/g.37422  ORF Transcript_27009/g.37422 Transcript_27009/m.37422 type:complete len:247 (+) Transcript_27009:78-818(+)
MSNAQYVNHLMEVVVAKLCVDLGFDGTCKSTLETLVDIGRRYIEEIGEITANSAELSKRTRPNVFDLAQGFDSMKVDGNLLQKFLTQTRDLTFPQPVIEPRPRHIILCQPLLPIDHAKESHSSKADNGNDAKDEKEGETQDGEGDDEEHPKTDKKEKNRSDPKAAVPPFLPRFPDEHTYKHSPDYPQRRTGREVKQDKVTQNSQVEKSLTNLQPGLDTGNVDRNFLEPAAASARASGSSKHWGSVG